MTRFGKLLTGLTAVAVFAVGAVFIVNWLKYNSTEDIETRVPYEEKVEGLVGPKEALKNQGSAGKLTKGGGVPSLEKGSWPQFRGKDGKNIVGTTSAFLSQPLAEPAKILWREKTGEGYAGAAVNNGRVYLVDYDQKSKEDSIRCLSLQNGKELWKYNYPVKIKRNHGMSRTVPAVTDRYLVTLGPLGQLTCLNAESGVLIWKKDLVKDYGTKVPEWYAGQCPLIDGENLIIAPAGRTVLITALSLKTGFPVWEAKNENGAAKMTHSSVTILDYPGEKQYIYCASNGVYSVSAIDGRILWSDLTWKINIANVPTPVAVNNEKLLLSGGYDSGSKYIRVLKDAKSGVYSMEQLFRVKASVFSSQQATPVYYQGCFYGVIQDGQLACIDETGKQLWKSGAEKRFGLGPFILIEPAGSLLLLNDMTGVLYQIKAGPEKYEEKGSLKILNGHEAWAPLALVNGKLIAKDLTELVCVELR